MSVYKINSRDQFWCIRGFLTITLMFTAITIAASMYTENTYGVVFALAMFYAIFGFPPVILHIMYWMKNRNTVLLVEKNKITIDQDDKLSQYTIDDILLAEKWINLYYKPSFSGRPNTWSHYGIIKVEMKDNKMFFFTSLMLDPLTFRDFDCDTKYSIFPVFNKVATRQRAIAKEGEKVYDEKDRLEEVNRFIELFKTRTNEDLLEKLNNDKPFKAEAREAALTLLKDRGIEHP